MFYAARSGKHQLAFECLENRHLLSADFGAVDLPVDIAKQAPAPAIITIVPTTQMEGQVDPFGESKSPVTANYKDHPPQLLTNHFGSFESGDLETGDIDPDEYDREPQQIVFVGAIRSAQIIRSELPYANAPKLIIELEMFKVTTVQRVVVIDYHQDDGGEGEADDSEIDTSSLHGVHESPVAVAIKASSPNLVAPSNHNASSSTARFAMLIETAKTQADESVASEQSATNLEMKSDRSSQPTNSPGVEVANPIQQPIAPALMELEPASDSKESASEIDAALAEIVGEGTHTDADSAVAINADEGPEQIESSAAIASVQDLITDVAVSVVPAARELISAGLSGDYEAIDLAMSQLLHDLDSVRTEATLLLDESTLRGLASTAVVGVIAAEVVRRRMREKSRLHQATIEEHLAIWMYPECSGVSGRPSL